MRNLANYRAVEEDPSEIDKTDSIIINELLRCGIEPKQSIPSKDEVVTTVHGWLGDNNIILRRAWSYWVAKGKIPIDLAIKMYEHPVGKTDIRSDGHCGCLHPLEYGVVWKNKKTGKIATKTDERAQWESFRESRPEMIKELEEKYEFVPDVANNPDYEGYVDMYHIDTELGLFVFVTMYNEYFKK